MEKYSMDKELLLQNLRNEEANLMQEIQKQVSNPAKHASGDVETRLQQVRAKITELDLQKPEEK